MCTIQLDPMTHTPDAIDFVPAVLVIAQGRDRLAGLLPYPDVHIAYISLTGSCITTDINLTHYPTSAG